MYAVSAPRNVIDLTNLVRKSDSGTHRIADGVGEVAIFGARQREVKVYINPESSACF